MADGDSFMWVQRVLRARAFGGFGHVGRSPRSCLSKHSWQASWPAQSPVQSCGTAQPSYIAIPSFASTSGFPQMIHSLSFGERFTKTMLGADGQHGAMGTCGVIGGGRGGLGIVLIHLQMPRVDVGDQITNRQESR